MNETTVVAVSHVAVCVSDLEKSRKFYTEALGFTVNHEVDVTPPFHTLTEFEDIDGHAIFMQHGPVTVELAGYKAPKVVGPAERRPMNQLGITHLAFIVNDLGATADRIDALGGTALRHTYVTAPTGDMMFATDPDGTRLELWEKKDPA